MADEDGNDERIRVVRKHLLNPAFKVALRSRCGKVPDDEPFKELLDQLDEAERRHRSRQR
jgi:hypothetical protein